MVIFAIFFSCYFSIFFLCSDVREVRGTRERAPQSEDILTWIYIKFVNLWTPDVVRQTIAFAQLAE